VQAGIQGKEIGISAFGLVEKVIAGSPKGDAAICNLMYIKMYGLLRSARNDWNGSFSTLPFAGMIGRKKYHVTLKKNH